MTDDLDFPEETQTSEERDQRIAYYESLIRQRDKLVRRFERDGPVKYLKEASILEKVISEALEMACLRVVDPDPWGEYRHLQEKRDEQHDRKVQKEDDDDQSIYQE